MRPHSLITLRTAMTPFDSVSYTVIGNFGLSISGSFAKQSVDAAGWIMFTLIEFWIAVLIAVFWTEIKPLGVDLCYDIFESPPASLADVFLWSFSALLTETQHTH